MIFVGDVAIADGDQFSFDGFPDSVHSDFLCINLEGAITPLEQAPTWGTYNSVTWSRSFSEFSLGPVFTANNHITDIHGGISVTQAHLNELGVSMFGAGADLTSASEPRVVAGSECSYVVLGFGWLVIGCEPAGDVHAGVNPFYSDKVRLQVGFALNKYEGHRLVILIHGNYEFEIYPQPAHRKLAQELVDMGVYSVIFHHPHVVGPIERYKGRLIAYSLGNWAFSYARFFEGRLKFPESSFHQIAVELGENKTIVHHANFVPPSKVVYGFSEEFSSKEFTLRPEFEGLGHKDYIEWFKKHRTKKKGLPIYRDPDAQLTNAVRDLWVNVRQVFVDMAVKTGLKRLRRGG